MVVNSILYAAITIAGASENLIIIEDTDVKKVPNRIQYFDGFFIISSFCVDNMYNDYNQLSTNLKICHYERKRRISVFQ